MDNLDAQQSFLLDNQHFYSSETVRSYRISLGQFFNFCGKDYDAIKPSNIRVWLSHMEGEGFKPRTINLKLSAVKSFYQYCMEEQKIKKDPTITIETPQKEETLPYYLSKRRLALLQELVKGNPRDRAIVETLYTTGVRISECLNIRMEDIKWESRQIWIRKGKGNKERFVLFTHECAERLNEYLEKRSFESPFLFASPRGESLSRCLIDHQFREFSGELGFKVTPHTLRHTFAAHLAEKNMPQSYIQELLGHANINSTHIYTRLRENARKKQYDRYQT
ncbi:site-specific tyrosine recombinase/integron integrase [Lentibacillus cibarius]|uniref:Integrase n=1 Tax=Lentibacillus cibarius TaxID=2583219 RepID=A0A5S3QN42_9BACI|nr:site-specific tyrosine recombinase/integron integrase [Lentibacillus cibarius]TMN21906.1 integrase [Lentibacillus cibarius]